MLAVAGFLHMDDAGAEITRNDLKRLKETFADRARECLAKSSKRFFGRIWMLKAVEP